MQTVNKLTMAVALLGGVSKHRLLAIGWSRDEALSHSTCPPQATCDLSPASRYPCFASVADCRRPSCCACDYCTHGPFGMWTSPSGIVLESLTTATTPSFSFGFNPLDADLQDLRSTLMVEPLISQVWAKTTRTCCRRGGLVVDVGANYGWYTLLSRSMGCSVVSFEPVAAFREVIQLGLETNTGFSKGVVVHPNVVFDRPGRYKMVVPVSGRRQRNDPTARLHWEQRARLGMSAMMGPKGAAAVKDVTVLEPLTKVKNETAEAVTIDDVVAAESNVCMLKVDVEGLESNVLRSGRRLLSMSRVEAMLVEVTKKGVQRCENIGMLRDMLLLGFDLYLMRKDLTGRHMSNVTSRPGFLLKNATSMRIGIELAGRPGVAKQRYRAASLTARRLYKRKLSSFSSNLLAWRGSYVPGMMLPDYSNLSWGVMRCTAHGR